MFALNMPVILRTQVEAASGTNIKKDEANRYNIIKPCK